MFFLAPGSGWLFARACGLIVIQCQDVKTLHQHFASCPRTRGFSPEKTSKEALRVLNRQKTASGVAARTANGSPFNPAPFNEEKLRFRDILPQTLRRLHPLRIWVRTQTKSLSALRKVNWSHSPDKNTLTRATAKRELRVLLCRSNNCLQ